MAQLGFHIPSLIVYLVNFFILLAVLYLVAYKPILRMLDARSSRIKEGLDEVERVRLEATERQAEMEKELAQARQEGQHLMQQAREMAQRYRDEETEKARQAAQAFIEKAQEDIKQEQDKAIEQVRQHFAELAIMAAERVIRRSLDKTAHRGLIDDVLQESGQFPGSVQN